MYFYFINYLESPLNAVQVALSKGKSFLWMMKMSLPRYPALLKRAQRIQ